MDFRQLHYFVQVADLGSFGRAANKLSIAQPALSRQIRNLEIEHNEALFIRTGKGVEPTEAGERLLSHARGILSLLDRINKDMKSVNSGRSGRIAIGMPVTPSASVATPLVQTLREQLPSARITLVHGRSSQLQEQLLAGALDMALVLNAPKSPMLETHQVSSKALALVGSPKLLDGAPQPIPLAQLARYPMVLPSRPNKIRVTLDTEMAAIGQQLNVILESDALEIGLEMARDASACAVRFYGSNPGDEGLVYRKIISPEISMDIHIILSSRRPISRLHDAAFEIMLEMSKKLLD